MGRGPTNFFSCIFVRFATQPTVYRTSHETNHQRIDCVRHARGGRNTKNIQGRLKIPKRFQTAFLHLQAFLRGRKSRTEDSDIGRILVSDKSLPSQELSNSRIQPTKLVLEVPEAELDLVKEILPQIMAKVDEGILKVPLVAEVGMGMNWEEAH